MINEHCIVIRHALYDSKGVLIATGIVEVPDGQTPWEACVQWLESRPMGWQYQFQVLSGGRPTEMRACKGMECSICNGEGRVYITDAEGIKPWVNCRKCEGKGWV